MEAFINSWSGCIETTQKALHWCQTIDSGFACQYRAYETLFDCFMHWIGDPTFASVLILLLLALLYFGRTYWPGRVLISLVGPSFLWVAYFATCSSMPRFDPHFAFTAFQCFAVAYVVYSVAIYKALCELCYFIPL